MTKLPLLKMLLRPSIITRLGVPLLPHRKQSAYIKEVTIKDTQNWIFFFKKLRMERKKMECGGGEAVLFIKDSKEIFFAGKHLPFEERTYPGPSLSETEKSLLNYQLFHKNVRIKVPSYKVYPYKIIITCINQQPHSTTLSLLTQCLDENNSVHVFFHV